jgi:hypothetical protein
VGTCSGWKALQDPLTCIGQRQGKDKYNPYHVDDQRKQLTCITSCHMNSPYDRDQKNMTAQHATLTT